GRVAAPGRAGGRGLRETPRAGAAPPGRPQTKRGRPPRRGAAGRRPVANTADVTAEGVRQIRALDRGDRGRVAKPEALVDDDPLVSLEAEELTILTCWAEAVAEALAGSPDQLNTILDDARAGAPWRRQLRVAEPSADLASAPEGLARMVPPGPPTVASSLAPPAAPPPPS